MTYEMKEQRTHRGFNYTDWALHLQVVPMVVSVHVNHKRTSRCKN